ncbi:HupE/UreJ family protein [Modestobacter altitudinis]|uniref:HupE/UreJ family protein n=1 Tax=Modestobacter altitudinis TaxID=2213158 RepID=UPI00110CE23C|nr:HupE/UreJ family protein [Modestobacter altitudinis]
MHLLRAALTAGATALLLGIALVVGAAPASAHPMPHTVVQLDVHEESIGAQLQVPVDDLSLATGLDLRTDTEQAVAADEQQLREYLTAHVQPSTDGRAWTVAVGDLSVSDAEQTSTGPYQELVAQLTLTPPVGVGVRQFTLDYDVVVDQVVTHVVFVTLRQDWAAGQLGTDDGRELGVIRIDTSAMTVPPLEVDVDDASAWHGFMAMLQLGGHHIAEGTDHLLFLLTLLLPAPLVLAGRRRWGGPAGTRRAAGAITRITLAFTVGHSITLALSALGRLELPARPVEALIAASILVSAVHAIRPLFPGREALVAGVFGLVHGMAFSFTLAELDLSTPQLVVSLLGFNLGIELVQLLVVAVVLPALVLLSPSDAVYRVVRVGGATTAGIAALGWLLDRLGRPNPVAAAADALGSAGGWVVVGLWVAALATTARRARTPSTAPATERQLESVPG